MMRSKCFGRATRGFSTASPSFSLSSAVKRRWQEQKSSGLWVTFFGGFSVHLYLRYQEFRQNDRMAKEELKRSNDLSKKFRRYLNQDYDDPKPGSKTL